MKKDRLKKLKKHLEEDSITLTKFLKNYCGIENEKFFCTKIGHSDIKSLMPYLKRCSFDYLIENMEEICNGNILLVKDSFGNVIPYENPMMQFNDHSIVSCTPDKRKTLPIKNIDESLNSYELIRICRYFKETHQQREYRAANKLLREKTADLKKYKVKKYKIEIGEENYEY